MSGKTYKCRKGVCKISTLLNLHGRFHLPLKWTNTPSHLCNPFTPLHSPNKVSLIPFASPRLALASTSFERAVPRLEWEDSRKCFSLSLTVWWRLVSSSAGRWRFRLDSFASQPTCVSVSSHLVASQSLSALACANKSRRSYCHSVLISVLNWY